MSNGSPKGTLVGNPFFRFWYSGGWGALGRGIEVKIGRVQFRLAQRQVTLWYNAHPVLSWVKAPA